MNDFEKRLEEALKKGKINTLKNREDLERWRKEQMLKQKNKK
ncbi:MAG: hypothetical protein SFU27_12425 [Thermonemataceae bacterium]|nr:hypothetical protein [Thermonemataceae bacterium]